MPQDAVRTRLDAGLAVLPFAVSEAERDAMLAYLELLNRWNAVHNLTAVRDPVQQVSVHVLDSLAVLPYVGDDCATLADIGSGAGLPALLFAIMRPHMRVYAVEASRKKAAFIRHAAIALGLGNVVVVNHRVEAWQAEVHLDVIVSRAMASLPLFLRLTRHLGDAQTRWLIFKGAAAEEDKVDGFVIDAPQQIDVPLLAATRAVYAARLEDAA
ncbi:MAG: 16S rRNA (guanine(527)-N(7))-methyltransferase RsmG [Cardiobacteriaceae bacterium]|nr:16S rRNA (guanine(527)-N(7))-methyltransferase RsmG [Cardiobacteriaceae bacterium]